MTAKDLSVALARARYVSSDPDQRLTAESRYELALLIRQLRDALEAAEARESSAPVIDGLRVLPATWTR